MTQLLSGATRLLPIVGDPIVQVKSPEGVTAALARRGENAVCVPMHVAPADLAGFFALMRRLQNCAGIIVTVPHKLAAFRACDTTSERAKLLGAVNTIRRDAAGLLHGDMFDGVGFVAACRVRGCILEGRRALLVGAGGAGSAIAHAVASAGVAGLGVADVDVTRRDVLVARLTEAGFPVRAAAADATGYDIVLNATPLGMRAGDPLPVPEDTIAPDAFVGDVITAPDPSPFIAAARRRGCRTSTGGDMFSEVCGLMVDYLLSPARD